MFKFYFIEIIGKLKFISFLIGAIMSFLFLMHLIDLSDNKEYKTKTSFYFVYDEILKHKIYITFILIFLVIIQIFVPSESTLTSMLGV